MDRVFISHSSSDGAIANAIVGYLEQRGVACWIAPRDVAGGSVWAGAIYDAIETARAQIVLCSDAAFRSDQVLREIELAAAKKKLIVPVRMNDVTMTGAFSYFLSTTHWINLFPGEVALHFDKVHLALSGGTARDAAMRPAPEPVDLLPPDQWGRKPKGGIFSRIMSMMDDKE